MPNTWSQIYFHIVFATKHRVPWMIPETRQRVWAFMGGIVREQRGVAYEIGGMTDHAHLLVRWRTDEAISVLVGNVKSRSTGWIRQTFPDLREFSWQEGGGVFSVSHSAVPRVRRYIQNQEEHHRNRDFKEEYMALLRAHGVEFDERYVFD